MQSDVGSEYSAFRIARRASDHMRTSYRPVAVIHNHNTVRTDTVTWTALATSTQSTKYNIHVHKPTLSNSSMQQMPLSASISAPASTQNSPVSASRTTEAVRPAAEEDLPVGR
jgi:hypothetical protein